MAKEKEFKVNDLIEVTFFSEAMRKDWIIIRFASNGGEAVLHHLSKSRQTTIELSKLKHQKRKVVKK